MSLNNKKMFSIKIFIGLVLLGVAILGICLFYNSTPYTIDTPYEYPITLDDADFWTKLQEDRSIISIPEEICKQMTTEALLESCLTYPDLLGWRSHHAATNIFPEWNEYDIQFDELFSREDFPEVMYKVYSKEKFYKIEPYESLSEDERKKVDEYEERLMYMEFFMFQMELETNDNPYKSRLLKEIEEKKQQKTELDWPRQPSYYHWAMELKETSDRFKNHNYKTY